MQAYAESWAPLQFGSQVGPVQTQMWVLTTAPFDGTMIPPDSVGQMIRDADGAKANIAPGPGLGFLTNWSAISGGGVDSQGFGLTFYQGFRSSHMPDGRLVSDLIGPFASGDIGIIVALVFCPASKGAGSPWELTLGGPPVFPGVPFKATWHLTFPALATSALCGMGGGGSGPPPVPVAADGGVDLLYWREGYHIATAGNSGIGVSTKWHWDSSQSEGSAIVDGGPAGCPKLSHKETGPPLGITYRRGSGTDAAIFRQESYDYGKTWAFDPSANMPFQKGPNGLSYAVEVWNERTGERVLFYNDQSQKDSMGMVTGKGNILCDVYGPDLDDMTGRLKKVDGGPFMVTPVGNLADNSSFGAIYVRTAGAIDCAVFVEGVNQVYRSVDDARTFQVVS